MSKIDRDCIVLPDYEVEPCSHNCPWCDGTMEVAIINKSPYIGAYGRYQLYNLRVYRCAKCSWESTPMKSFEVAEELAAKKFKETLLKKLWRNVKNTEE